MNTVDNDQLFMNSITLNGLNNAVLLLNSDVWMQRGPHAALKKNVVLTYILIMLRDAAGRAEKNGNRIVVTDDIPNFQDIKDLTDLIVKARDTVCHYSSKNSNIGTGRVSIITYGRVSNHFNGVDIQGEYDDDISFWFGTLRVYLKRNLIRMADELQSVFDDEPRPL